MNKPQPLSYTFTFRNPIRWRPSYQWISTHWFKVCLGALCIHLILVKDVKVSIQFKENPTLNAALPVAASQPVSSKSILGKLDADSKPSLNTSGTVHKAQTFYNLTFILSPDYAARKGISAAIVEEKQEILAAYLRRFSKIATEEQQNYGIPASITLAQGLLESNAGHSRLARESNNHFGIKCKSKCKGCTCRNYHDDDFYDMFRVFESTWESYREHSILLNTGRYKHLKDYGKDYEKWAHGLKAAGYATDKKYAEKLIKIIEALKLYKYD